MDEADYGNERMEKWLTAQIEEHAYQQKQATDDWPYGAGRCKNCGEKLDDSRSYCEEACRDDHWERIKRDVRRSVRS